MFAAYPEDRVMDVLLVLGEVDEKLSRAFYPVVPLLRPPAQSNPLHEPLAHAPCAEHLPWAKCRGSMHAPLS